MLLCIDIGLAIYCCPEPKKRINQIVNIIYNTNTYYKHYIPPLCQHNIKSYHTSQSLSSV